MIINKKGKILGVINIVDLTIIIVLIFGIYIGYNKLFAAASPISLDTKVSYEVEFTLKKEEFVDTIKAGDKIWDSVKGDYLGKVVNIEKYPSKVVVENLEDGVFEESTVPDTFDCTISIEANGRVSDHDIFAEGIPIRIGQKMYLKGKGYASQGFIIGIKY